MSFDPNKYLAEDIGTFDPNTYAATGNGASQPSRGRGRVAIVGMAGRFPGAADIDEFWRNLREGRESITFFPESEMELPPWMTADTRDPKYVRAAGVLDNADCFDPAVFGVTRREAEYMDPQQRVFLELCWTALEHAGYNPKATGKLTGVFAGTLPSTYLWLMLWDGMLSGPEERLLATVGTLPDNLTTRAAYKLNLRGPAVTTQTACSSSLVAIDAACQSLLEGKCEMALAGGVAIVFPQKTGYAHNPDLIESIDGHCRAFSKGSTGAIFSNGGGVVVLKRLDDAVRDGDFIHAVIAGSAVNNDGNEKIGYTAPSVSGQANVIRAALAAADVSPDSIGYVEAHGTGTPLGDPIEIAALTEVYGGRRAGAELRALGSVKTNIGHLNAAAGVAGLIKAVFCLRNREIPASLHFVEANPELKLESSPFRVNTKLSSWPAIGNVRRAAVSSFGIGGTNAHVILDEAPRPGTRSALNSNEWHLIAISGLDETALEKRLRQLSAWLEETADLPEIADLAFTLSLGRFHFARRVAFLARNFDELRQQLTAFLGNVRSSGEPEDAPRELVSLAKRYIQGAELDWSSFYGPGAFKRIPVPTYPFKRERIWFQGRNQQARSPAPGHAIAADANGSPAATQKSESAAISGGRGSAALADPNLSPGDRQSGPDNRLARIERRVLRHMASILNVAESEIDVEMSHADYGVDSLLAVEIIKSLNEEFGTNLRATDLFSYGSIRQLSHHLLAQPGLQGDLASRPSLRTSSEDNGGTASVKVLAGSAGSGHRLEDIAVIGMAGRFPGAENCDEFWENLKAGRNSITEIPSDRWDAAAMFDSNPLAANKSTSKWGGFLRNVDEFEPLFFNLSPKEAAMMDPQQRLFLQEAWHALEDAGYPAARLYDTRCGVFVGVGAGDYWQRIADEAVPLSAYTFTGNAASILAARIAYLLNLKGPAIALDTACSSSLVAIHLACQSIFSGDSDMALAGGVFIMNTPRFYLLATKAGMLSPDGACKAFDQSANGMVPGEGAGVVVLKRLGAAMADGDRIYGVIKASAVNQDGKTSSITAPSSASQTSLEREACRRAGIDPATITLVEAHGTGTRLGDPIELHALADAFGRPGSRKQYCAIGSVKTNIGHLMTAAGIAGVIKVLLCLRHGQIPPSLHFRQPNEHFDFSSSPFFVNVGLRDWTHIPGSPRIAAVSSFGFSGTNAHMVVCEPPQPVPGESPRANRPRLFCLSARTAESLENRARDLEKWLAGGRMTLDDLAYTLNCRRSHFERRVALLASDKSELALALRSFLAGETNPHCLARAETETSISPSVESLNERAKTLISQIATSQDSNEAELRLRLLELGRAYAHGAEVPWDLVYAKGGHHCLTLPGYPFLRQRCWFDQDDDDSPASRPAKPAALHPLVHTRIESNGGGAVFRTQVAASDPVLADHRVSGQPLLPGAAAIEIARAAAELACGKKVRRLLNIYWLIPVKPDGNHCGIQIRVSTDGEPVNCTIGSEIAGDRASFRSQISFAAKDGSDSVASVDLSQIRGRMQRRWTREQLYEACRQHGLDYGEWFQRVRRVQANDREALAEIGMSPAQEKDGFELHPALLDAAFQSTAVIARSLGTESGGAWMPFSVDEVELIRPPGPNAFAYASLVEFSLSAGWQRYDVLILDEQGRTSVRLTNYCVRRARSSPSNKVLQSEEANRPSGGMASQTDSANGIFYRPAWLARERPAIESENHAGDDVVLIVRNDQDFGLAELLRKAHAGKRVISVFLGRHFEAMTDCAFIVDHRRPEDWAKLATLLPPAGVVYFLGGLVPPAEAPANVGDLDQAQERGVMSLFRFAKAFDPQRHGGKKVVLRIITNDVQQVFPEDIVVSPAAASLMGFGKTLAREYPNISVACVDIAQSELSSNTSEDARLALARAVSREIPSEPGEEIAWRQGRRYVRRLLSFPIPGAQSGSISFRQQGVYLILGGASGIGLEVSRRLAENYQAKLILIGRKPLEGQRRAQIEALEKLGAEVHYHACDGSDIAAMTAAVSEAKARFGVIHGVIHSAVALLDAAIWRMDEAAFRAALDPKVRAAWVLWQATREEPLDFLVFFSSACALFGNPGQANYAAGCSFEDALGRYASQRSKVPVRVINWGLWGDVGIVANESYRRRLAKEGMLPFTRQEGLAAWEIALAAPELQVLAVKLDDAGKAKMRLHAAPPAATGTSTPEDRVRRIAAAVQSRLGELARSEATLDPSGHAALDRFARLAFFEELTRSGKWPAEGQSLSIAELQTRLQITPAYRKLYHALLEMLERADLVRREGERVETKVDTFRSATADAVERDLLERIPGLAPFVALLKISLPAVLGVMRGELDPLEVLFPDGSTESLASVYRDNPGAQAYNLSLALALAKYVDAEESSPANSGGGSLRLLEIGAGTGSATEAILPALAPYATNLVYDYTDISPTLVRMGRRKFSRHKFVQFKTLDIEGPLAAQGFGEVKYDAVIASGVLHATRRLRDTVRQVRRLLKPGGLLVLNEPTQPTDFLTLTFGLTSGWWLYADEDLRPGHSPLLAADQWKRLLAEEGFTESVALGVEGVGQHIIVGVCRASELAPTEPVEPAKAEPARVENAPPPAAATVTSELIHAGHGDGVFFERAARFLWSAIAEVLKVSRRELDRGVNAITFDRYGIDSLVTLDLTAQLEKHFGNLPKTLFFEYTNLAALTGYFLRHHRPSLAEKIGDPTFSPKSDPARPLVENAADARSEPATPAANSDEGLRQKAAVSPTRNLHAGPAETDCADIAIIGVSGRYPMADNLDEFWENLKTGRDCVTDVPAARWDWEKHRETAKGGRVYCKRAAFIQDMDKFDPLFFNISPREAELMDPQDRLFLQTTWEAMEDAGYTRQRLSFPSTRAGGRNRVGVFAGLMYSTYQLFGAEEWFRGRFVNAGSGFWCLSNRVSYIFDLEGPSIAVDTACSSSLTAIHLACESLRRGESDLAFAGGVNLILHPTRFVQLCDVKMLSRDGVCRPFGEGANGFVCGEGVGVVLLKPLAAALRDGDNIHGLIKGSAVNSGGKTNGFTVPNPGAQASLIREALKSARLQPGDIGYVEAHGTGTSLGDPVEFAGLTEVFNDGRIGRQSRALGSVKSNIGHLEGAAGIASLTKVMLMMKHRRLPPSLHSQKANPLIDFQNSPFRVQQTIEEWKPSSNPDRSQESLPLRAGVSSFGAGGANAHVVVEEYRQTTRREPAPRRPQIVVLSARNRERLETSVQKLAAFLEKNIAGFDLGDVSYSLQTGREAMDERLAVIATDIPQLIATLRLYPKAADSAADLFAGNARASIANGGAALQNSEAERDFVRALYRSGQLRKLASFWVSGSEFDWEDLRRGEGARRVSLPTYPFARDRYWVPKAGESAEAPEHPGIVAVGRLHPLIDANESTLSQIRFRRAFTRDDDYLRDHLVKGKPVLPGAAQLEMARAAAELARGLPVAALSNIVWMRPIVVTEGPVTVFTSISYNSEKLQFEIWTDDGGKKVTHSQGKIHFDKTAFETGDRDIETFADSGKISARSIDRDALYEDFARAGLAYGERFRTIETLSAGSDEALATLQLPDVWGALDDRGWHPALVDGAFQAIAGIAAASDGNEIHLPFAIGRIEAHRPLQRKCLVRVRASRSSGGGAGVRKFDIVLADLSGARLIQMTECSFRAIPTQKQPAATAAIVPRETQDLEGLLLQLERGEIGWEEAHERTRIGAPEEMTAR